MRSDLAWVLGWLRRLPLTPNQYLTHARKWRLASRIKELRNMGYNIVTHMVRGRRSDGSRFSYARYSLI